MKIRTLTPLVASLVHEYNQRQREARIQTRRIFRPEDADWNEFLALRAEGLVKDVDDQCHVEFTEKGLDKYVR